MRSFETTTELMPHQIDATAKLKPSRLNALLADMGTGKTRIILELIKLRQHKIDRVIIFTPVSLKHNVYGEILKHTTCTPDDIYVFDDKTNSRSITVASWYIVGIESMSSSVRAIMTAHNLISENSCVILDESTYCKNHHAKRTERITRFSQKAKYRAILTGTIISNGIKDLFAQYYFLSPKILGYESFYSFAANHLEYSDKYPGMVVRAHNLEYLAAKINPYTYQITKEECLNLPGKKYSTAYFEMTEEQREAYEMYKYDMFNEVRECLDPRMIRLCIFRLFSGLQQVASGFLNNNGRIIQYRHKRLATLMESIEREPKNERIVIWAKFQHDIERIYDALRESYGSSSVSLYYGKLNEEKREKERKRFHAGESRFFLATPGTGGHGLTLIESATIKVYNRNFKYAENEQMEDRCYRIGQTRSPMYEDIHCIDSIDDRIWKSYVKKGNLLNDFKHEVDKVKKEGLEELIRSL